MCQAFFRSSTFQAGSSHFETLPCDDKRLGKSSLKLFEEISPDFHLSNHHVDLCPREFVRACHSLSGSSHGIGSAEQPIQSSISYKICRSTLFREDLGISFLPTLLSKSRVRRPRPYHDNRVAARTPTKKPWGHILRVLPMSCPV